MSDDAPVTDAAIDSLQDAEFVTEFQERSTRAKRLTPAEMNDLYELEQRRAADARRTTGGIYRTLN